MNRYERLFTDQMNREVVINWPPERIVSIVPSQTELLYDLGLKDKIVGITKFCIHPEELFKTKPRVGGTKKLDLKKIAALNPDLIIGNKEENEQSQILELMQHYPVWMSDIKTLDESCNMIKGVGEITNTSERANEIAEEITTRFAKLETRNSKLETKKAAYFIWKNPYMVAGTNTFINDLLKKCHLQNVFESIEGRYPQVNDDMLKKANPEVVLLSSEPFPFKEKHVDEFKKILPNAKILIVDGELFSWYGTRLLHSPNYFEEVLKEIHC